MRCPIRAGKVRRICAACSSSSRGGYHSTVYWIGKGLRTASGSAEVSFHRSSKSRCLLGSKEGMSWQCSPASEDAHLVTSLDLMEETGYPITSREISGLDPDTENRGQPMLSIAIKKTFAMIVLATATITSEAADVEHPPKYLVEPVFGLRVALANVKLDPLPDQIRAVCAQMADNGTWTGRQWIFGVVKTGEATYYLVSGYFERQHPEPGESRFHLPDQGGIYVVKDKNCGGDPARDVFEVRDFEEIPQLVLEQLAQDLQSRLVRAFGGDVRLRAEIKKQRIARDRLTPELSTAFSALFWVNVAGPTAAFSPAPR